MQRHIHCRRFWVLLRRPGIFCFCCLFLLKLKRGGLVAGSGWRWGALAPYFCYCSSLQWERGGLSPCVGPLSS
eukprot:scaffold184167_cov12-Tisochrysis_lutea.AAC.1